MTDQILIGHGAAVEGPEAFSHFLGRHYNLGYLELLVEGANIRIVVR